MPETPEDKARVVIDANLALAGWVVQNRDDLDLTAGLGVAVREFPLKSGGAKRVLFLVDRGNLGKQTEDEFVNFTPPDDTRKFPTL